MLLMYACGLRITEAATLEVTAIDGIIGFIRVIGKGNKERQVPLPQPVLAELRSLWKTHRDKRWLFPSPRQEGPISRYALWLTFKQAVRAAGITRRITPHSLRHSYATRLLESGVDIRVPDSARARSDRNYRHLYAPDRADGSFAQAHPR